MRVFVVMGNDYPEAVFKNKVDADEFVEQKKKETAHYPEMSCGRIYWRHYEFGVRW